MEIGHFILRTQHNINHEKMENKVGQTQKWRLERILKNITI